MAHCLYEHKSATKFDPVINFSFLQKKKLVNAL